jgi:hypothetical protein
MAKDVALREIDLAGFRISNLGNAIAAGDATKTDNVHTPLASRGFPSAGGSMLAAPADHIHPLPPDLVALSDPALQVVGPMTELWFGVVDFDQLVGDVVAVGLSSMLQSCLLLAWLDGEVGNPTAGTLVMNINTASPTLVPVAAVGSAPFPRPSGAHLLTLTAQALAPATEGRTLGRVLTLRGLFF